MKRLLLPSLLLFSAICNAQFWTENFNTAGCSSGNPAIGYSSSNGTWSVVSTGTNDSYADIWYVSSKCSNTGSGNCASGCIPPLNATLHIGNADLSSFGVGPDSAATYLTGVFCSSFSVCSSTHKRVESPVINCSGHSGITVSFIYIEGGELSDDDATLWYNDGSNWAQLDPLAKTTVCATSSGIWTSFNTSLPSSANNNPNVKIGFQWTNDNDGQGSDPSFAVDDIALSSIPSGTENASMQENCNVYCDGRNINVQSSSTFKVISLNNILGENIPFMLTGNLIELKENSKGVYFIKIEIGKNILTRKIFLSR